MNELELIDRLTRKLATNQFVVVGAGDDCAVLEGPRADEYLLLKTDAVVEGIHFAKGTDPERVGHKALGRCLSDFAAMAGTPLHAVITLGLPEPFDPTFVEGIYSGLNQLAKRYGLAIVGGETVKSPERLFLSVAATGKVGKARCVLRSGGQPGDALFVTGQLGGSLAGKHLDFEPRLAEAHWLTAHFEIHAMIDLSDGLASDLRHLLRASKLGAEVLAGALPISRAARSRARSGSGKSPLAAALTDGEDFELLFALPSRDAVPVLDRWKQQFPGTPLTCIGKTTSAPGLLLRTKDGVRSLTEHGYVHFA
jgi:thiamine-monophosphate kinase